MDDSVFEVSERIFSLLKERGIEQKEFAAMIGTTDKTVSAWATKKVKTFMYKLPQIVSILDTTYDYLFTGEEKKLTPIGESELSEVESALLSVFRQLPENEQQAALKIIRAAAVGSKSP